MRKAVLLIFIIGGAGLGIYFMAKTPTIPKELSVLNQKLADIRADTDVKTLKELC